MPHKYRTALITFLCAIFVLAVYVHYLARDIIPSDSADLVGQAYRLGVCHVTGYPSTVIAGKLFTWIPIGNIPYRINLLSAVSATLTVVLTILLINLLIGDISAAVLGGMVLGLCPIFWWRAESANVHMFATLLTITYMLLYCLFMFREKHCA